MKKMRILVIFIVFTLISLSTFSAPLSSIKTTNAVNQSELLISFNLNIDIKARNPGGEWQDISLTADNGGQIEFKLTLTSSGGRTLVVVLFPYINEEPMMQYQSLSASHVPAISDESCLIWGFVSGAPDVITFKVKLLKTGTGSVDTSICDVESEETREDTVNIISQGGCCFLAGTKITMADGSTKNIEDIKIGDKVLSYNFEKGKYSSWIVKMLGRPIHPVCNINNGLIFTTADHPFFVKKENGLEGIGAIDAVRCKNSIVFKQDVFALEVGDKLFTQDGNFVEITSITSGIDYVQTYNILSFSGTRNFFANGILVFEEHPANSFTSPMLEKILEKMPRLAQFFLSTRFFNRIFTP